MSNWRVIEADVMDGLAMLQDERVQTVVTSPPYWGLRDYGMPEQLGLEATPELYVERMVEVFRDIRRVLRSDGTLWLNLGDSYASSGNSERPGSSDTAMFRPHDQIRRRPGLARPPTVGLKPKDLVGIPWMVAFALRADGWWLRSDIIWAKSNPMPESVTDRPTKSHEYLFLLTKSARYYFDADAVRETGAGRLDFGRMKSPARLGQGGDRLRDKGHKDDYEAGRNLRSVWNIATEAFPEAHFATFPKALVVPCVKAGSAPGDTVLDPFCGSGTTGVMSLRLGRSFVGIELSPEYAEMARRRIADDAPLFNVESELTAVTEA